MDAYSRAPLRKGRGSASRDRSACVAEKWSLTNRIRGQFARIKAAGQHRYQLWLLRKTRRKARWNASERVRSAVRRQKRFEREESQDKSGP